MVWVFVDFFLLFFFFQPFTASHTKNHFPQALTLDGKEKKKKKKIVPASKIFQLLCLLVLGKKRGSIHTILPDSEL